MKQGPPFRLLLLILLLFPIATFSLGQSSAAIEKEHRDSALALERQGWFAQAETEWWSVLKTHPADAEAYAHLGLLEAHQEHYQDALPLYRKAMALDPRISGLRLNFGLSLFKSGEMKEAIVTFSPLLRTLPAASPDAMRVSTLIGLAHFSLGEFAAAIPSLRKAAAHDPTNLQFRFALAQSCLRVGQYQCVLDVYREILNLNAESAEADMLAGEAMDEMKNPGGAIEQFRAAVKADPREPNAHFGLGYLLWTQNQFDEAAREFQAELANVPGNALALAFLADSEIKLEKPEGALPLIQKALQIDPSIERAHLDLGILYSDAGRQEDAVAEFKAAIKLSNADPDAHWRLARLYSSMGKKDDAKTEFQLTSNLHKADNDSIFSKLKEAQDKGSPSGDSTSLANSK